MSTNGTGVRMSVRILDEKGSEIASFFSDTPEGDEGGFSASLRTRFWPFARNIRIPTSLTLNLRV
jgi:hypothetical protein